MMYFVPRKLLSSHVSFHKTTTNFFVNKGTCFMFCPTDESHKSDNEHYLSPPSPPPPSQKYNMPMFFILMLCVLGAAFIFLCYLTLLRRHRSNLGNSIRRFASFTIQDFSDENSRPVLDHPVWHIRTVGLEQSLIDSIPVFKYKKSDDLVEGTDCSVCLSEFQEDESLRLLPKCSHAFHIVCIDTWLRSHKNCPLCRAPIVHNASVTTDTTQLNTGQALSEPREDATTENQQENDENGEDEASLLRIEGENIGPLWNEQRKMLKWNKGIRVMSDLGDHRVGVGEELQSVRRSFSLDLSSASRIYTDVAKVQPVKQEGSSSFQEVEVKKQNLDKAATKLCAYKSSINRSRKSFSFGRSLQSVPIRMKRSFSSSGKFSLARNSRSQELDRAL